MPHPKRKISKSRRDKRRTHDNAAAAPMHVCPTTGTVHLPHTAYKVGDDLYYRGQVIIPGNKAEAN